jgi:hypothetical protein
MRHISKLFVALFVAAVCLLVIGLSSPLYADDVAAIGRFSLSHATQVNKTVLAPGEYSFMMIRTDSNARVLKIQGGKQTFNLYMYPQEGCKTCGHNALTVEVNGENWVASAMDLDGFHASFKSQLSELGETAQNRKHTQQVAVRVASK